MDFECSTKLSGILNVTEIETHNLTCKCCSLSGLITKRLGPKYQRFQQSDVVMGASSAECFSELSQLFDHTTSTEQESVF